MNKTELLAPAGNLESFMSAISAGTDAVYLGLKDFSARAKAKNFSYKQLNEVCNFAHKNNVKVFVALNTLIKWLWDANESMQEISSMLSSVVRSFSWAISILFSLI